MVRETAIATMRLQYRAGEHAEKPIIIINAFIERDDSAGASDVYHIRVMKGDDIRDFWNIPYLSAALLLMSAEVDNLYNERD